MIENHFIKGDRVAQYEFKFDFCPPNSKNTWEYTYEMPKLSDE